MTTSESPKWGPNGELGWENEQDMERTVAIIETTTPAPTIPPTTPTTMSPKKIAQIIDKHKMTLTIQLRTAQMDGGNILFKVISWKFNG